MTGKEGGWLLTTHSTHCDDDLGVLYDNYDVKQLSKSAFLILIFF